MKQHKKMASSRTLYIKFLTGDDDVVKNYEKAIEKRRENKGCYQENGMSLLASIGHLDSGFDIFTPKKILCKAHTTTKIPLGIACACYDSSREIPYGYYLYPRSSLSKTPLRLANSVGIIDSGYRGELVAMVDNIRDFDYVIEKNQRLFQICSGDLFPFQGIKIVSELNDTQRGGGGFGSTGI
jgi:dUTP pyrophosphatase